MPATAPIVLIDDDADDIEIIKYTLSALKIPNQVIWLEDPERVIDYLLTMPVQPFLIFCDINMPRIDGVTLKMKMDNHPVIRKKSIPFIFYTTAANPQVVDKVFAEFSVQGFFRKQASHEENIETMKCILEYWKKSIHPNSQ